MPHHTLQRMNNNSPDQQEESVIATVIEIIIVIVAITFLAQITAQIRLPDLIASTKNIIAGLGRINIRQLIFEIGKSYFIYILLSIILLLCVFYVTKKQVDSNSTSLNTLCKCYCQKYLKPVAIFILMFYIVNVVLASQSRIDYTRFYEDFKQGNPEKSFLGYKLYHFLNHADQTKLILARLGNQTNNEQEAALVEGVKDLVKKQDKSISTFRSYLANYNLLFKLVHIFYYSVAFVGSLILVIILCMHNCFVDGGEQKSHYGSIQQHEAEQESGDSLTNCPQANSKRKKCMSACYILFVLIIFSAIIFASFVLGDLILELKIGHPYDHNIEQKQVCSFHKLIGGLYINIDYQNQLELLRQFGELKQLFRKEQSSAMEQVNNLQQYLKIYISLCELFQPYYLRNKDLQTTFSALFYRQFYAFIYIFWRYLRVMKEAKVNEPSN